MIEVGEEQVQRLHPLDAAALHGAPFAGLDAAGNDVEGNQALGALLVAVQGEGDTGAVEQQVGFAPALVQKFQRSVRQPAGKPLVVRPADAIGSIHFIKESAGHSQLLAVT